MGGGAAGQGMEEAQSPHQSLLRKVVAVERGVSSSAAREGYARTDLLEGGSGENSMHHFRNLGGGCLLAASGGHEKAIPIICLRHPPSPHLPLSGLTSKTGLQAYVLPNTMG